MACGMRWSKVLNENDENDENNNSGENYKQIAESNGMRDERVQIPQRK